MFSVYGIVKLAQSVLFNGKDINTITIPELNFKAQSSTGASGGANNPSPLVPPASRVVDVKNPGTSQPSTSNTAPTQPNQPRQPSSSAEPYKCSPGFECTIPETNGQIGLCNATGNACASNAIQQGGCTSGKHYDSEARGCVPDDTSSEPYKCSPGFDCTIPGTGQTGVCNATGNACASNAISEPANPQGGQ
jgi:hypothetical protein